MKRLIWSVVVVALAFCSSVLAQAVDPGKAAIDAASVLMNAGKIPEAIVAYKAVAENKSYTNPYRGAGLFSSVCLILVSDKPGAMAYMEKAKTFDISEYFYLRAVIPNLYKAKEWQMCLDSCQQFLPQNEPMACQYMCKVYAAQGNRIAAMNAVKKGLLSPDRDKATPADALDMWKFLDKYAPTMLSVEEHKSLCDEINRSYPPPGQDVKLWSDFLALVRFRLESLSQM